MVAFDSIRYCNNLVLQKCGQPNYMEGVIANEQLCNTQIANKTATMTLTRVSFH